ncbi:MAG: EAL domain-containing protein [Nitrospirae bacterium]|nr:EAL domain-containing protein [Nitrospirota bacterium]
MLHVNFTEAGHHRNHKIIIRIISGFIIFLLMIWVLVAIGINSMNENYKLFSNIINYHDLKIQIAEDMRFLARHEAVIVRNIMISKTNKDAELKRYYKAIKEYENSRNQLIKILEKDKRLGDHDVNNLVKEIIGGEKITLLLWDKAIKLSDNGDIQGAFNLLVNDVRAVQWKWLDNIDKIVEIERKNAREDYEGFLDRYNKSKIKMIILGIVTLIIGTIISMLIIMSISKPLKELIKSRTSALEEANTLLNQEVAVNKKLGEELQSSLLELKIHKFGLEHNIELRTEEIKKNYDLQNVISTILKLSYKNLNIKEFLDLALDILFSLSWFAVRSIGCIFLYDETEGVLKMAARKNFPRELLEPCKEVQVGRCLCGLAASRKEMVYKACIDSEHEITYHNISEHGHYCVPIIMKDRVLGIVNVDVDAGHKKDKIEEQLLLMFADTLASIIERKRADEKLEYMANYDALTGVPNRMLLFDRLTQSINLSKRYKDKTAVMYLDMDQLKLINDKYGHDAGDVVLKKTTNRLKRCVRDTDTISRLGGDEFAIVTRGFNTLDELIELCNRIIGEIGKPIEYRGKVFSAKASIGISIYPEDGSDAVLLLKKADTAMYNEKTSSGGKFLFYKESMEKNLSERDKLEEDIRYAISSNQFVLYYQPQIDLGTNKLTGVEALIRWKHPVFGMIYPDKFIPLAEETGLIIDIGKWVMRTACEQNILWHKEGLPLFNMAVNVASNEFQQHDFVGNVLNMLSETQMDPTFLEIEITERISIQDIETTIDVLYKFNNAGIKVSLDDFGTGYSSLSYLKRLPFNKIKIDKSFVMDIQDNEDALVIVKTIIDMAHNLKKPVIAEGIETPEHLELLKALNCDEGQGYLFSKPMSAEDFMEFAKEHQMRGYV